MAQLVQASYRWRNDDAGEAAATWAAASNTSISGVSDATYRLRIQTTIQLSGSITWTPQLQYNKNSAGWNNVTGSSSVARSTASPHVTDNAATTEQMFGGGFLAGKFDEGDGTVSGSISLDDAGSTTTEHEFAFQVRSADVAGGDVIDFRLVPVAGGTYSVYTHLATWLVPLGYAKGQFMPLFD